MSRQRWLVVVVKPRDERKRTALCDAIEQALTYEGGNITAGTYEVMIRRVPKGQVPR